MSYIARVGFETDVWLNVVFYDGQQGETISQHAARDHKWTGCVLCWLLGILIERNHCAKTIDPTAITSTGAAIRSLAVISAAFGFVIWALSRI